MRYSSWRVGKSEPAAVDALRAAGFSPLTALVLASRGYTRPEQARSYVAADVPLLDPFLLKEMDGAVARITRAIADREKIAVFGDYDVDGITATCLLTDALRNLGADCRYYIPARLEEGYGLNEQAIRQLAQQGVRLIVTVDCGITATEEAALCQTLGVELVITDHHECRDTLPQACAVIDPHRPDATYPHKGLCGVGIAFKLASALYGDQEQLLARYADLVCLGTVADVMPLAGENRTLVAAGLQALRRPRRPGIAALMSECGLDGTDEITATTVGYLLAPRINAAGRMGRVEIATELFLTKELPVAAQRAAELCALNRQRQQIEADIYQQAVCLLRAQEQKPHAVVLSGNWHQGVVGIVASRLAEEYACPTFLICMDGEKGKASSRSYGGFNLYAALDELSGLLESYGGHELAAGFTIREENIPEFRRQMDERAAAFASSGEADASLHCDCEIPLSLLTQENVEGLKQLEPCGNGCEHAVFCARHLYIEQLNEVGGGKHLRLRLKQATSLALNAIFFSETIQKAGVCVGDCVDVVFKPQLNFYRGVCTVQLQLLDLRPSADRALSDVQVYRRYQAGLPMEPEQYGRMLPERSDFAELWRCMMRHSAAELYRASMRDLRERLELGGVQRPNMLHMRVCLDVFAELGLITVEDQSQQLHIKIQQQGKVNLSDSAILRQLRKGRE